MLKGPRSYPTHKLLDQFPDSDTETLADIFGVSRATILRWRDPNLTINQWDADRYAVKVGRHPGEIWAEWFNVTPRKRVRQRVGV